MLQGKGGPAVSTRLKGIEPDKLSDQSAKKFHPTPPKGKGGPAVSTKLTGIQPEKLGDQTAKKFHP